MTYRLVHPDSDREYLRAPGEELQTDLGVLTVPEDVTAGDRLETHLGEPFDVRDLRVPDLFEHFERTGAPMVPRDIGLIIAETGASVGDRVLDAGTGTGVLAASLARVGATVHTYEVDAEFAAVARENVALAGVADRVDVRTGDVTDAIDDLAPADYDVLTLDTADAPSVVAHAPDLLTPGGFLAVYSPFVENARETTVAAREAGLAEVRTVETIQRRLRVDDRGTRPDTAPVGHTGYVTLARQR